MHVPPNDNAEIHMGQLIQRELDKRGISRTFLARAICCTRPNVNKIVKRQHINTDMLLRISRAIGYNFFTDLSLYYENHPESSSLTPREAD